MAYWPALASLGDFAALAGRARRERRFCSAVSIALFSPRFGDHAIAAAGVVAHRHAPASLVARAFAPRNAERALRQKEWTLLRRDPWLVSQTLMQILYLLPPAFLLWRSFEGGGALLVLVPVLVMAAGQLAGGLAWLAISGEDAPDLVATAPVPPRQIVRAKIEAVMGGSASCSCPSSPRSPGSRRFTPSSRRVGILVASASATQIQLWFRAQAKRSQFRRRQISSRVATFAEAFSSITWAGTAALAAAGTWLALIAAAIAVGILLGARLISPRQNAI